MDAARPWTAGPRLAHCQAPGDNNGRRRSGRCVLRHDERRSLGQYRRRRVVAADRAAPTGDLLRRSRLKVSIPTPLRSYTGNEKWVEADGATIADLLADLDNRYPGMRFRVVDEQ